MPGVPAPDLVLVEADESFWRLGRIPRCASADRPRPPGCVVGRGAGCSSAGRRVHRWHRCGGSANGERRCRCRLRPAAETTPRSTGGGRAPRGRRSVSARRVQGSAPVAHRHGSGRRRWVPAGWPRPPGHTPGGAREPARATAGQRHRLRRRSPTPQVPRPPRRGRSAWRPASVWSRNPAYPRGFRHRHTGRCPRSTTWVATVPGRSGRVRAGRRRSDTPPLENSRSAQPYRCTDVAPRPSQCPFFTSPVSSTTKIAPRSPKASMT